MRLGVLPRLLSALPTVPGRLLARLAALATRESATAAAGMTATGEAPGMIMGGPRAGLAGSGNIGYERVPVRARQGSTGGAVSTRQVENRARSAWIAPEREKERGEKRGAR